MPQNAKKKKFSGLFGIAILRKSSSSVTSYQDALVSFALLLRFDKKLFYPFVLTPISMFIVMPMCFCASGCQHSTLNRLFGCFPARTFCVLIIDTYVMYA